MTNHGTVVNRGTLIGIIDNHGTFENRGDYASPQTGGVFGNRTTGRVDNYGYFDAHTLNVANSGHFEVKTVGTFVIFNGVAFTNDGGTTSNSGTFRLSKTTDFINISGGAVANNAEGHFFSVGYGTGSGTGFINNATVNNAGIFTNHDIFYNNGAFSNSGELYNRQSEFISPLFANAGTLDNSGNMHNVDDMDMSNPVMVKNSGILNNFASIINTGPGAAIENGCGAAFNDPGPLQATP